jgi:hypothetical protein
MLRFIDLVKKKLTSCSFRSSACLAAGLRIGKAKSVSVLCRLSTVRLHRLSNSLDLLEDASVLVDTHCDQLLASVTFIQDVVGMLPELLHVRVNQHLTEFYKVTVGLVVDFDSAPWVGSASNTATVNCGDKGIRTNDGERHFALYAGG